MSASRTIILPTLTGEIIRSFELDPLLNLDMEREEFERCLRERNVPFTYYDGIFIWNVGECQYCISFADVKIMGVDIETQTGRTSYIVSNVRNHAFGNGLVVASHRDLDAEKTRKNFARVLFP